MLAALPEDAVELRDRLAGGALSATDLARACLERVRAAEGTLRAFAWLDERHVLREAGRLDRLREAGGPLGPLHGLPVGVKDIVDTAGIPTENGTALDAGRVPGTDAAVVRRLKAAGAYVFGKTVTAELAFLRPGPTTNPHDPARTPGGSSQGSAAAVAAGMVPLAIGTQTGGSVIRPASFCGVVGFKPSFGMIARTGILAQSPSLDTVGVLAGSVAGAALLAEVLAGHDPGDPASRPAPPGLLAAAPDARLAAPTFAILRSLPGVDLHPDMAAAMDGLAARLGGAATAPGLPAVFDHASALREAINLAELSKCYDAYERRGRDRLSHEMRDAMDRGRAIPARDYLLALDAPRALNAALEDVLAGRDAILCPAAPGPAPQGLGSTGSAACNGLWTLCGVPAVTLPLFASAEGLPLGLQLVGRRGDDAALLTTARRLWAALGRASARDGTRDP